MPAPFLVPLTACAMNPSPELPPRIRPADLRAASGARPSTPFTPAPRRGIRHGTLQVLARFLAAAAFLAILFGVKATRGDLLPIPPFQPDPAQVAYLRRSLALLESATPSNRIEFRILIYGQSFSAGPWSELLLTELKQLYPDVTFVMTNKALAGLNAWFISYAANADVGPWQPDLILFNTLFDEPESYERLFATLRESCTADVIIHADPPRSTLQLNESLDPEVITRDSYQMLKNYFWWPELANRFSFCFADIRTPWKQYLLDHGLPYDSVLVEDKLHFNDDGHKLQSRLLAPFFKPGQFATPFDPYQCDRVSTRRIDSEIPWVNGSLEFKIFGNRVDLEYEPRHAPGHPGYTFTLDAQNPRNVPSLFSFDRTSRCYFFGAWPAILHVKSAALLDEETWTLTFHELDTTTGDVSYSISGSKTGPDGSGSSLRQFVSNSRRVVIEPNMVMIHTDYVNTRAIPPAGWEAHFNSVPRFREIAIPKVAPVPGQPSVETLFLSSEDREHVVRMKAPAGSQNGLRAVRVYSPSGRASLTNAPPFISDDFRGLNLRLADASVILTWPASWGQGAIQKAASLGPLRSWSAVPGTPTRSGERFEMILPQDKTAAYFRWVP